MHHLVQVSGWERKPQGDGGEAGIEGQSQIMGQHGEGLCKPAGIRARVKSKVSHGKKRFANMQRRLTFKNLNSLGPGSQGGKTGTECFKKGLAAQESKGYLRNQNQESGPKEVVLVGQESQSWLGQNQEGKTASHRKYNQKGLILRSFMQTKSQQLQIAVWLPSTDSAEVY